jgi:hypothetical protein
MSYLRSVVRAKHRGGFRIHLTFDDGFEATVDFEHWLRGSVFAPVRSRRYFVRFFVDGGGIVWPNGADIAPEALYDAALAKHWDELSAVREKSAGYKVRRRRPRGRSPA